MKSDFVKGEIVRTTNRIVKQINKGKLQEPIIDFGVVVKNEHFGRIVKVRLQDSTEISTKPEYLERISYATQ